jgi:hypothetical protein
MRLLSQESITDDLAMGKARGGFNPEGTNRRLFAVCFVWLCCTWLFCIGASLAIAQAAPWPQEPGPSAQLLTVKQGRAIVNTAREHNQPTRGTQDCSHLVHEIYARAGFAYPYASSFDLYAGSESFERVKKPQPGDLIVWPGHAGIVFDPRQHIFYSLVSSGLDAADYEGPYWRSRGKPRFYRYVAGNRGTLVAAGTPPGVRTANSVERHNTTRVVEERSNGEASTAESSAKKAAERSAVFGPVAPEVQTKGVGVPRSIAIAEGRKQPTREEVAEGILELSSAAGSALRSDSSKSGAAVIIFGQLRVENIEIKRDHGWALVQMESNASVAGDQTDLQKHNEEVRWELRRGKSGWEAVSPVARTYVPRDVAVRDLAARLAELTQSDGGVARAGAIRQEESRLAKVLSALLENE